MALTDVVISYLGKSLHLPLLTHPWQLIIVPFTVVIFFSLQDVLKIKIWILGCFFGLIISLLIGYFTIHNPAAIMMNNKVAFKILPTDLITMTTAFLIGSIWILRTNISSKLITDHFLALSAFHALICLLALLKISPSIFPLIDAVYYNNGVPVSRPEITTDQTRQALYLLVSLCVVFTQKSLSRNIISLAILLITIFIITKVQSRMSTIVVSLFTIIAYLMAIRFKVISMKMLFAGLSLVVLVILWKIGAIINFLANLIWRFQQVDDSYGGRAGSIMYLFEKLAEPSYWIPTSYNEFFQQHGAAPHSFHTMVYLNAGLLGLICYLILIIVPLSILFKKILKRTATDYERIGFFCGSFTFLLSLTQPVINHEIFWLMAGLTAGALSRSHLERKQM